MSKYKFSIVIPIYNVEEYLEETILSVINQTIGFEKNIQMILINDGSPDNSEEICLKYKELFPNNIVYVKQKNGGVSSARNKGLEYVEGEYVNFLDSDDFWPLDACAKVYKFFSKNKAKIDVVACMMEFFEARTGLSHPLNKKFRKGNRIIDINLEPKSIQMHNSSCFIKSEAVDLKFNEKLKYAEDSLFVNEIIMRKEKYGVMKNVHYLYRKRYSETSAIDTSKLKPAYYNSTLENFHDEILKKCRERKETIIPYIQYVIMYDIQWRIKEKVPHNVLERKEIKKYREHIKKLLKNISDEIILDQENIWKEHKIYALNLKHGYNILKKATYDDGEFYFRESPVYSFDNRAFLKINVINIFEDKYEIAGQINCCLEPNEYNIYYSIDGKEKLLKLDDSTKYVKKCLDGILYTHRYFKINDKLSKKDIKDIKFFIRYKREAKYQLQLGFTIFGRLSSKKRLHYVRNGYMLYKKKESIIIRKKNIFKCLFLELYFYMQLIFHLKYKQLIYRSLYHLCKPFHHKPIWLISDRTGVANDNGMHLFKYMTSLKQKEASVYFVVNKKSKDFKMMQEYGKVLPYGSLKYKIYFLMANKIISSQADSWVTNPFGKANTYYRDLYRYDFVFLQHGIIKDNLSSWLNYYDKNIKLFVTSVEDEWASVLNSEYGYDKNIVKLTGLPRYDNLNNEAKKQIAIMPTWRKSLSGRTIKNTGVRAYNEDFINSEYFNFYNTLINDKRLIKVMEDYNYKGIFVVHPSHMENHIDFQGNKIFDIVGGFADYQKIFRESKLLLSDFSSVPFDFAYLYKPVVYTHFDKDTFFENHLYTEGYFSYEKNGFGPVVYNYEDTIKQLIAFIKNDCIMEQKYIKRVDKFYKFHDRNNCKRVYSEIKKMK